MNCLAGIRCKINVTLYRYGTSIVRSCMRSYSSTSSRSLLKQSVISDTPTLGTSVKLKTTINANLRFQHLHVPLVRLNSVFHNLNSSWLTKAVSKLESRRNISKTSFPTFNTWALFYTFTNPKLIHNINMNKPLKLLN